MILVKDQRLYIPSGEDHIGTTYDNQTGSRTFKLERLTASGADLSELNFYLDLKFENGVYDTVILKKKVEKDVLYLEWEILNQTLKVPGGRPNQSESLQCKRSGEIFFIPFCCICRRSQ